MWKVCVRFRYLLSSYFIHEINSAFFCWLCVCNRYTHTLLKWSPLFQGLQPVCVTFWAGSVDCAALIMQSSSSFPSLPFVLSKPMRDPEEEQAITGVCVCVSYILWPFVARSFDSFKSRSSAGHMSQIHFSNCGWNIVRVSFFFSLFLHNHNFLHIKFFSSSLSSCACSQFVKWFFKVFQLFHSSFPPNTKTKQKCVH